LALGLFSVVGGFEWGGEVEAVHEAAGVEPVDLRAGHFFELLAFGGGPKGDPSWMHSCL
jgi:hypothetical protein